LRLGDVLVKGHAAGTVGGFLFAWAKSLLMSTRCFYDAVIAIFSSSCIGLWLVFMTTLALFALWLKPLALSFSNGEPNLVVGPQAIAFFLAVFAAGGVFSFYNAAYLDQTCGRITRAFAFSGVGLCGLVTLLYGYTNKRAVNTYWFASNFIILVLLSALCANAFRFQLDYCQSWSDEKDLIKSALSLSPDLNDQDTIVIELTGGELGRFRKSKFGRSYRAIGSLTQGLSFALQEVIAGSDRRLPRLTFAQVGWEQFLEEDGEQWAKWKRRYPDRPFAGDWSGIKYDPRKQHHPLEYSRWKTRAAERASHCRPGLPS
jgi:hypothetical protein